MEDVVGRVVAFRRWEMIVVRLGTGRLFLKGYAKVLRRTVLSKAKACTFKSGIQASEFYHCDLAAEGTHIEQHMKRGD